MIAEQIEAIELELELIQSHMAQKPVLRGEVGCAYVAREVSVEREEAIQRAALSAFDAKIILYVTAFAPHKAAFPSCSYLACAQRRPRRWEAHTDAAVGAMFTTHAHSLPPRLLLAARRTLSAG